MTKFVCIHGHFYQPPRENAWSGAIEDQISAKPYKNWNERILNECYKSNLSCGNYQRISFNFGPTLLSWMEKMHSEEYHQIIESDQQSMKRFSGHGAALAQAYNHIILPLANSRDKQTQIIWGIKDFQYRFQWYIYAFFYY